MVLNNNSNNAHFKLPCKIFWNISLFQMYYCINVKNRNFKNNYSLKNKNLNSNVLTCVGTNTLKLSTDKSAVWTYLQSLFSTCLYKSDTLLWVSNIVLKRFDYQIWVSLLSSVVVITELRFIEYSLRKRWDAFILHKHIISTEMFGKFSLGYCKSFFWIVVKQQ